MAWVVGVTASANTVASVTTAAIDTTGANTLACMTGDDASGPAAPTDSKSNTWTNADLDPGTSGAVTGRTDYVKAATVGTGHTFTGNVAGTDNVAVVVDAFSGRDTAAPLTQHGILGQSASGNPHNSPSVTTTEVDDLWGAVARSGGEVLTTSGAWTLRESSTTANNRGVNSASQNAVVAGTYNSTFTDTPNNSIAAVIAILTFKAPAAAVVFAQVLRATQKPAAVRARPRLFQPPLTPPPGVMPIVSYAFSSN